MQLFRGGSFTLCVAPLTKGRILFLSCGGLCHWTLKERLGSRASKMEKVAICNECIVSQYLAKILGNSPMIKILQ